MSNENDWLGEGEVLVKASVLDEKGILPKSTAYRMAKLGQIPCYMVGTRERKECA